MSAPSTLSQVSEHSCILKTSCCTSLTEGLSASGWNGTTCHSLCACCQLLERASVCIFPKTAMWLEYQVGEGSVLVFGDTCECVLA